VISLNFIFAVPAILSAGVVIWQWLSARKFPLHKKIAAPDFAPAITLLKPLKGCDGTTTDSLQSWFNQNYAGQIQILFGVTGADDPVCKIVGELLKKYPRCDAQLVACGESLGANAKVSTLIQLERRAKYPLILVSDADVRVPPDFLPNLVAPLSDPKVGLVNCFYRLANPATTAMRWEAIAINADFWSQVLQAIDIQPLSFALGAVMLARGDILKKIGGFNVLADCLADDYMLGRHFSRRGHRIALCSIVVECWDAPMNWSEVWKHQLRWARTIRVCQPVLYFLSIFSNATLWPLVWLIVSFAAAKTVCVPLAAAACILVRILLAQNLQRRLTPDKKLVSPAWLVPVKDLLQAAIWVGAFLGNTIEWRGRKMKLRPDGTLVERK
jgi:ceramide glucosyltransferase